MSLVVFGYRLDARLEVLEEYLAVLLAHIEDTSGMHHHQWCTFLIRETLGQILDAKLSINVLVETVAYLLELH